MKVFIKATIIKPVNQILSVKYFADENIFKNETAVIQFPFRG